MIANAANETLKKAKFRLVGLRTSTQKHYLLMMEYSDGQITLAVWFMMGSPAELVY
jgi:hypothetical protein